MKGRYRKKRLIIEDLKRESLKMLLRSQPLDPKVSKKLGLDKRSEFEEMTEKNIESQYIGT